MQFQKEIILIIDFGSQVTKLIARRVRDLGVYSEIITPRDIKKIKSFEFIKGIILSGGPSTVTKNKFQRIPMEIFKKKIPVLGICMVEKLNNQKKNVNSEEPLYSKKMTLF